MRFRVRTRITEDNDEALIARFFQDAGVRATLSVRAALRSLTSSVLSKTLTLTRSCFSQLPPLDLSSKRGAVVTSRRLRTSVTDLSFFDRLTTAGVVSASGALRRCADEWHDGAAASDLLADLLVNPESEHAELFDAQEQDELLFRLLRALVVGGALRQSDDAFAPYERAAANFYRALVSVVKSPAGGATGERHVVATSRAYEVAGGGVFPGAASSRHSSCFVVLDARKRWLTLWRHDFKSFW